MCKHARRTLAHEREKFTGVIVDAAVTSLCRTEIKWQAQSNCYTDCVIIQVESTGGNWQSKRPFLAEGKINSHERRQVSLIAQKEMISSQLRLNKCLAKCPAWWCSRAEEFSLHKPKTDRWCESADCQRLVICSAVCLKATAIDCADIYFTSFYEQCSTSFNITRQYDARCRYAISDAQNCYDIFRLSVCPSRRGIMFKLIIPS